MDDPFKFLALASLEVNTVLMKPCSYNNLCHGGKPMRIDGENPPETVLFTNSEG